MMDSGDRGAPGGRARPPSLLAVFAHPDDESLACGGLLAHAVRAGARVSLLCLTRGEHGPSGETPSGGEALGDVRARELEQASRVLGIHEVMVRDHEDGMLPWVGDAVLESDIRAAIRQMDADVVVTFDEDGLYGHPDHVAVHERTTAVVASLGPAAPALRYVSMPRGAMRAVMAAGSAYSHGEETPSSSPRMLGGLDPDAFGAMAPPPTFVVDAGPLSAVKLRALQCHRTQVAGNVFETLTEVDAAAVLGIEHYRAAPVGGRGLCFIDTLAAASPAAESS